MNKIIEEVKARAVELVAVRKNLQECEEFVQITQKERIKKIRELTDQQDQIGDKIARLRMEISEADPENAQSVEDNENKAAKLMREIKSLCHSLPVQDLMESGIKIFDQEENPNVVVTVSKVQTTQVYDTEALLDEYPELLGKSVDGDFVISRAVNAAVLERLAEEEAVPQGVFKHRNLIKMRNPSVKIS